MNWVLKMILNQGINMLEGVVMAYVAKTPEAWDDELATQLFDFLKRFVNGTVAQQKAAFVSLRNATTALPEPTEKQIASAMTGGEGTVA